MTDPTSLSTLQSPLDEEKSSSKKSASPSPKDFNLSEIPVLPPTNREPQPSGEPSSCTTPNSNPESDEITKYEYEFSFRYTDHLSFVYLYDSSDVSACERVIHRPVKPDEITYSETNGFITDGDFKFTFKKSPYKRTYIHTVPTTEYHESVKVPPKRMVFQSAADVLASL